MEDFLTTPNSYNNSNISDTWTTLKKIRKVITGALEKKRAEKIIGSSLEAHIDIYLEKSILEKVKNYQMDEISITSSFSLYELNSSIEGFALEEVSNVKISVSKTTGKKCQRCWKYKQELIRDEICNRCEDAIT